MTCEADGLLFESPQMLLTFFKVDLNPPAQGINFQHTMCCEFTIGAQK